MIEVDVLSSVRSTVPDIFAIVSSAAKILILPFGGKPSISKPEISEEFEKIAGTFPR